MAKDGHERVGLASDKVPLHNSGSGLKFIVHLGHRRYN